MYNAKQKGIRVLIYLIDVENRYKKRNSHVKCRVYIARAYWLVPAISVCGFPVRLFRMHKSSSFSFDEKSKQN